MLGFEALGRLVLGASVISGTAPVYSTPLSAQWRGLQGTGYCASVVCQVTSTASTPSSVQVNSFDVMYEQGGLL